MSIRIGIGKLAVYRGGGDIPWSSYCTPQDLVLITVSDSSIAGHFAINGTVQDGHKVYISTDNVTFTLLATLTGVINYFAAKGLTTATTYYIKVVAYKGSQETDAISGSTVTFNSAMIAGWRFDEEIDDCFINVAGDHPGNINYSVAQYYNGVTYIVYNGASDDPYIITYTHATDTWSIPVQIGTADLSDADDHGNPAIIVDSSGYIHCMWDGHSTAVKYAKSDNPEDISAWTLKDSPITGTYPQLHQLSNGTIYLFYRSQTATDCLWGYKTSADGGATWSDYVALSEDIAYWYFRKGVGDTFHAAGFGNNQTALTRKNLYYIFFNGTNWVNITGDVQPSPIVLEGNNCLAYNSGDYYTPNLSVSFDSTNKPVIIFPKSVTELDLTEFDVKLLKHNGSEWVVIDLGLRAGLVNTYRPQIDIISDTEYHAYLLSGNTTPYSSRVEKWISNDAGLTWYRKSFITDIGNFGPIELVKNAHLNARILFFNYFNLSTLFNSSGFLYGDNGFVGKTNSTNVKSINGQYTGVKNVGLALVDGKYGKCYQFDGDDNIDIQDSDLLSFAGGSPDKPFSITLWLYVANTTDNQRLLVKAATDSTREYYLILDSDTLSMFLVRLKTANQISAVAPFTTVNTWVFVCVTYDGAGAETGLKIYLNNVESQTSQTETGTYTGMQATTSKLNIGSWRGTHYFVTGMMDELKIWNKVLSPTEMGYVIDNVAGW